MNLFVTQLLRNTHSFYETKLFVIKSLNSPILNFILAESINLRPNLLFW
jgi:hypothetical protein